MGKTMKVAFAAKTDKVPSASTEPAPPGPDMEEVEEIGRVVAGTSNGQPRGIGSAKKNLKSIKKPELKPRISQGARAGILFPVARIRRYMKNGNFGFARISATSAVCVSAILEYMVAEILEMAIEETTRNGRKTITPHFINTAVREDYELNNLLNKVTIAGGGVVPYIHANLLIKSTPKKRRANTKKGKGNE